MKYIKESAQVDESTRSVNRGYSRSSNEPVGSGSYTRNRNSERSNAYFKCKYFQFFSMKLKTKKKSSGDRE
ncbi:unnamed protein product [Rotaria sp. Silwood1]|nr:unnamed protein product [Rotaria sp. Silwood1]CAF1655494.1 unnamed protein product [Rotaria sp. Silwood1]